MNTSLVLSRSLLGLLLLSAVHGTPAAAAEPRYDGGFVLESGDGDPVYRLRLNGRIQTRLTLKMFDDASDKDTQVGMTVEKGRLGLDGYFLTKALTYKFQADFGKGAAMLKDFYFDYAFTDGVHLRAGQWDKPWLRQQITSDAKTALVERASINKLYLAGRDVGLVLHSDYEVAPGFEWAVGVFNGQGENVVPEVWQPEGLVRLGYGNFGKDRYSEGDVDCDGTADKCGLRYSVGLSVAADGGMPKDGSKGQVLSELDFVIKIQGLELNAAYMLDYNLGADDEGGGMDKMGISAQLSYFIAGPKLLPAFRFTQNMPDDDAVASTRELTLGLAWLPAKHNLKWSTDATMITNEVGDTSTTDWLVRTQAQVGF